MERYFPNSGGPKKMNSLVSIRLDAMRAIAALSVFCSHFAQLGVAGTNSETLWTLGRLGVIAFFLMSGYVIAYVAECKHASLRDYMEARFARLYSVFIPAIALTATLDCLGRALDPTVYQSYPPINNVKVLAYIPFFLSFMFENSWFSLRWLSNGPFWSIAYEFWYYVVFGILIYWPKKRLAIPLAGALLLAGWKVLLLAPIWILGVLIYRYRKFVGQKIGALRLPLLLLSATTIIWLLSVRGWHWLEPFRLWGVSRLGHGFHSFFVGDYILAIPLALMLTVLTYAPAETASVVLKPFISWAAGFSFSLYLYHVPLILFLKATHVYATDSPGECVAAAVVVLSCVYLLATITEHKKHIWLKLVRATFSALPTLKERTDKNAREKL
jgi:peptidoglycan/LPS O-acetylase OafA/YrhL